MSRYFVLVGRTAVEADSLQSWSAWFLSADHEVARTRLPSGGTVATAFVGVDPQPAPEGRPLLFETRSFDPNWRNLGRRQYATWSEAERGHLEEVRRRRRG